MIRTDDSMFECRYVRGESNQIWKVVSYCPEPSVTVENEETGEQKSFGITSYLCGSFKEIK